METNIMKKITIITIASLVTVCITTQLAGASNVNQAIHFSGKLHVSKVTAAKDSSISLTSMKLKGSNPGSTLRLNTIALIEGPVTLKKASHLNVVSLEMNNAQIGGSFNSLQLNTHIYKGINAADSSDIGIGGLEISADDNYNQQPTNTPPLVTSNQSINIGTILTTIPSDTIGTEGAYSTVNSIPQSNLTGQQLQVLGQRDPRWKNMRIGNTNLTMGDYGCLVTSLAMLKGTTPDKVNRALTKNNGFTSGGYLRHDVASKTLGIGNGARHGKDWEPTHDTVAEVRMRGRNGKSYQHFVVWRTDGTILDPWTGKSESQSKYPLVSFRDYHKG